MKKILFVIAVFLFFVLGILNTNALNGKYNFGISKIDVVRTNLLMHKNGEKIMNKIDLFVNKISDDEKKLKSIKSKISKLKNKYSHKKNNKLIINICDYINLKIDSILVEKNKIIIIDDKRRNDGLSIDLLINSLKEKVVSLKDKKFEIIDFSESENLVKKLGIKTLPVIIFDTNKIDITVDQYLVPLKEGKYYLNIGASFDPYFEICDNKIDDNKNGKIDCEDPKCSKELICSPKVNRPKAELFVMSYCPFGTQAQKGYLQVMDKLGKVADVKVRFVNYLMHGEKEGEQNLREYCVQKEQNDKFVDYLRCFLDKGKAEKCLDTAKINKEKLNKCIVSTKKEINYDSNISDPNKRFPIFTLQDKENNDYKIIGSPTFVLNGIKVDRVGRNAKSYAELICNSFKNKPKECNFDFNDTIYDAGFGFTSNGKKIESGCNIQ